MYIWNVKVFYGNIEGVSVMSHIKGNFVNNLKKLTYVVLEQI
jgi:hypothetical protein